uniref:Uncharacterized protein n=1 Tax=Solanum tuberosum TaxID=4113 RepID=M1DQM1_SOLTU
MAGITSSRVNSIYYNAGFKSYEITRCKGGTDSWYEWTESSRKLVRRVKISIKVLRWLVSIFIEASKVQGKVIRTWKLKEHFAEFYCSLKYNENGRFVSFIAIQGQNKSIIITPEASYMGGWSNIVHKIAKFIYEPNLQPKPQVNMGKQSNTSYREAVQSSRWMTDSMKRAKLHVKEAHIEVTSGAPLAETDLLNKCIVGRFQDTLQETPALNDNDSNTEITEDVVPLDDSAAIRRQFNSKSSPLWIKQHILKLSTEFGVDFRGCEEKAEELFMKIDNNKQGNKGGKGEVTTNKRKEQTN